MEEEASSKPQKQVVLIIDHDNMHLGVQDWLHENKYKIQIIKEVAEKYGVVCKDLSKVYLGPYYHEVQGREKRLKYNNTPESRKWKKELKNQRHYLESFNRIGMKYTITESHNKKSLADQYILCNIMEMLHHNPKIDVFVLCTGDKDFIPLVKEIKKHGKMAVGIGVGNGNDRGENSFSDYLIDTYAKCDFESYNYTELKKTWDEKHKPKFDTKGE